ncbi:hypothetical protein RFI_14689 [Reticulomyxa filosa]|uniref:Uncharacterized protein n=1 Tax=Reticulomyxa filosa TaxID=46433 RepID=X6NB21_RETFI|nr:hypothetical protein RFI_14689 [Reticulomyxa filosa]|eukprot:ETO22512.1 hypothetical protein RFI_14689 [Reticulomyxa filosa]
MYDGGICISFKDLFNSGEYNKYNATANSKCDSKGRGSAAQWNLYAFQTAEIALQDLGCYDMSTLTSSLTGYDFKNFEGLHYLLQDNYTTRASAVSKCAQVAYENDYPGFALINNGACILSKAFKNVTLMKSGLTIQNQSFCSNGQGTDKSYSVYQFPYLTKHSKQQGLTNAEIIAIATFASLFGAVVTFFSVLCVRKYKGEKSPWTKWQQDWLSRTACARCHRCRYCLPLGLTPFCCSRWLECKCQCCKNQCKSPCKTPCKTPCKSPCKVSCKNPCQKCCNCREIPKRLAVNPRNTPQTAASAKTPPPKPASATTTTVVTTTATAAPPPPPKVKIPPKVILR